MPDRSDLSDATTRIPLYQETLDVAKRTVETGRVRIETRVDVEALTLTERLTHDAVEIERVPLNQRVDQAPPIREEGDLLIVPVLEERLVVERQLFVVEELVIRRSLSSETIEIPATRRVMRAVVTRDSENRKSEVVDG